MNEWGIPDWRDESAYGDTQSWSLQRWFWEFLRRRDDLRREFDEKKDEEYQDLLSLWRSRPMSAPNGVIPPNQAGFSVGTMLIYQDRQAPESLPNPRIGDQPYEAMPILYDRALTRINRESIPYGDRYFRIDFNLDLPIAPQLEMAKNSLLDAQVRRHGKPIQKRRHQDKWLTYLRVLDAREAGATWAEIAKILPRTAGSEQSARDTWEQANDLRFNF